MSGVIVKKAVVEGMLMKAGEEIFRIADLSSMWLIVDVYEQDLALAHVGQSARISLAAYPGKTFTGKVTFIYPTLNPQTRTAQLRIELQNAQNLLKPAMYANVELVANPRDSETLTIPTSAVIHSGTRQVALVQLSEGRFEPRLLKLGMQADQYVEVLQGLSAGEEVVTRANFLLDAESNLQAALQSFGAPDTGDQPKPQANAHAGH